MMANKRPSSPSGKGDSKIHFVRFPQVSIQIDLLKMSNRLKRYYH